jgi:hypothetical protein
MALDLQDGTWYLDGHPTYSPDGGYPNGDPRLRGLLLNHRVINGIFDDLNPSHDYDGDGRDDWAFPDLGRWDPEENTRRFLSAMPRWREAGVLAFTIGLQGGNPFRSSPPPEGLRADMVNASAFEADGSLHPAFMARLRMILGRADDLGMVPIVNLFYQGANRRVREDAVLAALGNAIGWLLDGGHDRLIIDVANECSTDRYWPALRLERVDQLVQRVRDLVADHNARTGDARRFFVGASLLPGLTRAERVQELPESYLRAVDVLMPHGNGLTTEEVRAGIAAMRGRSLQVRGEHVPILFNEDIEHRAATPGYDVGGDLAHLEACLDGGASWGNLIRSHQWVPCREWYDGSDVQRAWFALTRRLTHG